MTRAQQLESMKEGDKVYRMPYRQYKQHYADCEKVITNQHHIINMVQP